MFFLIYKKIITTREIRDTCQILLKYLFGKITQCQPPAIHAYEFVIVGD